MHSFISWKANDIPLKIIVIILNNYLVLKRLEKEKKSHDANPESHKKSLNVFSNELSVSVDDSIV